MTPHRPRRWLLVAVWVTALAAPVGAIGYLMYANLLNPRSTELLAGTYDGFYWDAAQLQIAYARLENQLLLYRNGQQAEGRLYLNAGIKLAPSLAAQLPAGITLTP